MANGVLYAFMGFEALFIIGGILLLAAAIVTRAALNRTFTIETVANTLLLSKGPLTAAIVNAVFVFLTFLLCIPSVAVPTNHTFLQLHGYLVIICAVISLVLGLEIWFETLNTRANLLTVWSNQTAETQSLLQQKFNCCGYLNATTPPFITDSVCTDPLVATNLQGCVGPFSSFANSFLSKIFTVDFGIVAIDVMLVLAIACLLKDRKEKERYRLIDAKVGFAPI